MSCGIPNAKLEASQGTMRSILLLLGGAIGGAPNLHPLSLHLPSVGRHDTTLLLQRIRGCGVLSHGSRHRGLRHAHGGLFDLA